NGFGSSFRSVECHDKRQAQALRQRKSPQSIRTEVRMHQDWIKGAQFSDQVRSSSEKLEKYFTCPPNCITTTDRVCTFMGQVQSAHSPGSGIHSTKTA